MDLVLTNSGFQHIIEKIFMNLDQESLILCTLVSKSMAKLLKDPRVLVKILQNFDPNFDGRKWNDLLNFPKKQNIEDGLVNILKMRIFSHKNIEIANTNLTFDQNSPLELAIILNQEPLMKFIFTKFPSMKKMVKKHLPQLLEFAIHFQGSIQLVKFLISKCKKTKFGLTKKKNLINAAEHRSDEKLSQIVSNFVTFSGYNDLKCSFTNSKGQCYLPRSNLTLIEKAVLKQNVDIVKSMVPMCKNFHWPLKLAIGNYFYLLLQNHCTVTLI